jgi:Fic family protein
MTDIINGKQVLGPPDEICEVRNAFEVYKKLLEFKPSSIKDLLLAYKLLMHNLTQEAGTFRSGGVGIFAGEKLVHMASPADRVPELVQNLFTWLKKSSAHPLIQSCVFHYEFEFIHPFADGNGRMGRLWQTLLLSQWNELFSWLPVETLVKSRQDEYYKVLARCDREANSGYSIDYMLQIIHDSLIELTSTDQVTVQETDQVARLLAVLDDHEMTARQLMAALGIRHRPTFRTNYLLPAIKLKLVELTVPDKPNSKLQRYRRLNG